MPLLPFSQEQRDLLRVRAKLDAYEAMSEQRADLGHGAKLSFDEQMRLVFEEELLRNKYPASYQARLQGKEVAWADSWKALERYSPDSLNVVVGREAFMLSRFVLERESRADVCADEFGLNPLSVSVLIESPVVSGHYFSALKITTVESIARAASFLNSIDREGIRYLFKPARHVYKLGHPLMEGRFIIVPDDYFLRSRERLEELAREFFAKHMSADFAGHVNLKWFREPYVGDAIESQGSSRGGLVIKLSGMELPANAPSILRVVDLALLLSMVPDDIASGDVRPWHFLKVEPDFE